MGKIKMSIIIRKETNTDYKTVENLIREAFWNVYRPGCQEHFILHKLRSLPHYLPELALLLEEDSELLGQIAFCEAKLVDRATGESQPIAQFGPFSVLPHRQKEGLGANLLHTALEQAKAQGIKHILIYGNPNYYQKFGFRPAQPFGIYVEGQEEGQVLDFVLYKSLVGDNLLKGRIWDFIEPEGFIVDPTALEAFDKHFPPKEKQVLQGQLFSE